MTSNTIARAWAALSVIALGTVAIAQDLILAHGETPHTVGQRWGFYQDTWVPQDGLVETLAEWSSGGKRSRRTTRLEHDWQFVVPAAAALRLHVRAARTPDRENFVFFASVDGGQSYALLPEVYVDSSGMTLFDAPLPDVPSGGGLVLIRAENEQSASGATTIESLHVDFLALQVVPPGPPPAPSVPLSDGKSAATILVGWTDNSLNEDGFRIERSLAGAGAWGTAGTVGPDTTTFLDAGLLASTSYDYRVVAFHDGLDSAPSDLTTSTTRTTAEFWAEVFPGAVPTLGFWNHDLDALGSVGLGWGDETGVHVATRSASSGAWLIERVDTPGYLHNFFGDFAFARDGTPSIVYATAGGEVRFAERRNGVWNFDVIDAGVGFGLVGSLAYDPTDPFGQDLAVAYNEAKASRNTRDAGIQVARRIAGQWTVESVVPEVYYAYPYPALAFESGGALLLAHRDLRFHGNTMIALIELLRHDGTSWSTAEVVEEQDSHFGHVSLSVDPTSGRPSIGYGGALGYRMALASGTGWTIETAVVKEGDQTIDSPRIAYDRNGTPRVAFIRNYGDPATRGLYVAWRAGTAWSEELVDAWATTAWAGGVGLRIDDLGRVSISYIGHLFGASASVSGLVFAQR